MKKLVFLVVPISFAFIGCAYELDCSKFKDGILNNNEQMVGNEIDQLCVDLYPNITNSDPEGQQGNLYKLADRINTNCEITATVYCYNCIETNPPQSELKIELMVDTTLIVKYLDIIGTNNHMLKFAGMHE